MEEKKIKTSIGGQALLEGIMMRGPKKTALAVRNSSGEIVTEEFPTKGANRPKICKMPIIRGIFGYIDSMVVGYKALMRSADLSGLGEVQEEGKEPEKIPGWAMTLIMVIGIVLGTALAMGLFVYLPSKLFDLLSPYLSVDSVALNSLIKSAFEGILKIVLLVGYMMAVSLMKDIRRTFMYHGAEHKTIFCYEAGLPLTVENVRKQRRFHPRCGTSFLILMLLVSIFISFFIDPIAIAISGETLPVVWRFLLKLLLVPLIVGLGYELIKFAGRNDNLLTKIISAPGMWLQHITVFEPTDDMIECAISAVNFVIPNDGSDQW